MYLIFAGYHMENNGRSDSMKHWTLAYDSALLTARHLTLKYDWAEVYDFGNDKSLLTLEKQERYK